MNSKQKRSNAKNTLVPVGNGGAPVLYQRMQAAIAECHSIDDCKNIATQAGAIAAYYDQIQDDESVRKFLQVKIRAWRRIGEILLSANIDRSECNTGLHGAFNKAEYIRRIRAAFKGHKDVEELNDGAFSQALKIAEMPDDFFARNAESCTSISALLRDFADIQRREWEASPEGQAQLKEWDRRNRAVMAAQHEEGRIRAAQQQKEDRARAAQQREEAERQRDARALVAARDIAFDEVGITLDRRDRERMHQIVFLLKKSIHKILRQAAFDNRMTMQAILRSGLMMWLVAHGYTVPADDMKLPQTRRTSTDHAEA
jgi:hypothetical protein